jgi:Abnormal spindle-like microcephaly-assoc'd, ASPM-SPD-2-Hydin
MKTSKFANKLISLLGKSNRDRSNKVIRQKRRSLLVEGLEQRNLFANFSAGNLAVFSADNSTANNSTFSILEIDPALTSQTTPVQTIAIPSTGSNALRTSGSASSTGYLSNSNDNSLLVFSAHNADMTGINPLPNANTLVTRGVGTLDSSATFNLPTTYTGTSGQQTRSATTIDNATFVVGDQAGVYTNGSAAASPAANVRAVKSFGGNLYVSQASGTATVIQVNTLSAATGGTITGLPGLTNNGSLTDYYLIQSGSNGTDYDVLYITSATSGSAGTVSKFSLVSGSWVANGTQTTTVGGFGLVAKDLDPTNTVLGADLFFSSGNGATTANTIRNFRDTAGFNQTISISPATLNANAGVLLYTAAAGTTIKGVAFAPTSNTPEMIVRGSGVEIVDGDSTPDIADGTSYGSVLVGATPIQRTFTIQNQGGGNLSLPGSPIVSISGSSDFSITTQPPSSSLGSGLSTTFVVTFTPSTVGTQTASLSVANNDSNENPYNFSVSGLVQASAIPEVNLRGNSVTIVDGDTTPDLADHTQFPVVNVGSSFTRSYTIENTGTGPLTIGTPNSTGGGFTIQNFPSGPIAPSTSATFDVVYTPGSAGPSAATISFNSNDTDEAVYNFSVSGTGFVAPSVRINEARLSSPTALDDLSNNFVEVFHTSGSASVSLSGLTLVVVSSNTNFVGSVDFAVDLATAQTDANGFVLITDDGSTTPRDAGDVTLANFDLFGSPSTFLLVTGFSGAAGNDLDTNNDGIFDSTPWTSILDSVSVDSASNAAFDYSPTVVLSADTFAPAGFKRVVDGTGSYVTLAFNDTTLDSPGFTNATPGVVVTQSSSRTVVTEGGNSDTLQVVLNSPPTANVTVNIIVTDGQTTPSISTLTFTPTGGANPWNIPQTLTISAVNDTTVEGNHSSTLNFASTSTDATYNGISVAPITATVIDNEGTQLTQILINELHINAPGGTDTGLEYIELRGTPGATIPGSYYLNILEGDTEDGNGNVDHVFYLGGLTIGSNGYLVLLQVGNTFTTNTSASTVVATGVGWGTTFSSRENDLENGTNSYLLVQSPTEPTPSVDVDALNNGMLTGEALTWTVVDSIGIMDGGANDTGYARTNFSALGLGIINAPNTIFDLTTFDTVAMPPDGFTPDYVGRAGNSTGQIASSWVAADIVGSNPSFMIETVEVAPLGVSGNLDHIGSTNTFTGLPTSATITNRQIFYNNSSGFGTSGANNAPTVNPILAIDPSKTALLPGELTTLSATVLGGQNASSANFTNYSRGLNGIVVDMNGATNLAGIDVASFQFATWSSFQDATPNFVTISPTVIVSTFAGGGLSGAGRIKLAFADNTIQESWLRVTVLANASTGLTAPDVFYFGNARGDITPNASFPTQIGLNALDLNQARNNQLGTGAVVSNIYDVDKNGAVNGLDLNQIRARQGTNSLRPFTAPSAQAFFAAHVPPINSKLPTKSLDSIFAKLNESPL